MQPAVFSVPNFPGRVLIFGIGHESSGVMNSWRAADSKAGVYQLGQLLRPYI